MDFVFFFFFSSRRRHTRYWRDWSSDVCSSDLHSNGRTTRLPRKPIPTPTGEQWVKPRLSSSSGEEGVSLPPGGRKPRGRTPSSSILRTPRSSRRASLEGFRLGQYSWRQLW